MNKKCEFCGGNLLIVYKGTDEPKYICNDCCRFEDGSRPRVCLSCGSTFIAGKDNHSVVCGMCK